MTRINTIPVERLADQHLLAEYRELPRIFSTARALKPREAVPTYRLGKGHVLFFYDKLQWLSVRHQQLVRECQSRGFEVKFTDALEPIPGLDNPWTPTEPDHLINLSRLRERLEAKPGFYRHRGAPVSNDFYSTL